MDERTLAVLIPRATAGTAPRGPDCPEEERLVGYVRAELDAETRARLELHLADCDFCRGQVGFLARAAELGPPPAVPVHLLAAAGGERARPFYRFRLASLGLLVAAALAAVVVLLPSRDLAPAVDRETRAPAVAADDAPRILHPAEGASLPAGFDLWWSASPGALAYAVELVDADGDLVWQGRAESVRLKLPADLALEPGRAYFVWVVALLPDGGRLRSPVVGFRVAPV